MSDDDEQFCPVCGTIFMSSATQAMMQGHINACLDGGATASAGVVVSDTTPTDNNAGPKAGEAPQNGFSDTSAQPRGGGPSSNNQTTPAPPLPAQTTTSAARIAPDIDEIFGTLGLGAGGNSAGDGKVAQQRASGVPSTAGVNTAKPPAAGQFQQQERRHEPPPSAASLTPPAEPQRPQNTQGGGGRSQKEVQQKEESMLLISALFPGIPSELAEGMLEACAGDTEQAVRLIEEMRGQQEQEQRGVAKRQRENQQRQYQEQEERLAKQKKKKLALWEGPVEVELIVYDLKPEGMSRHFGFGVYHSAVIIAGKEFAYGGSPDPEDAENPGVFVCTPECAAPVIKKRTSLGHTTWTPDEVFAGMEEWGKGDWKVGAYHLLSKNCNHFTKFFLEWLSRKCVIRGRTELEQEFKDALDELADMDSQPRHSLEVRKAFLHEGDHKAEKESSNSSSGAGYSAVATAPGESGTGAPVYQYRTRAERKLSEKFMRRLKDNDKEEFSRWEVPAWVNRAARLGDTVVPTFVYNKVVEKETGQTPNDTNTSIPPSATGGGGALVGAPTMAGEKEDGDEFDGRLRPKRRQEEPHCDLSFSGESSRSHQQPSRPQPAPAPAPAPVDPAAVASIKAILPHLDDNAIEAALQTSHGNADRAIDLLLS